MIFNDQIYGEKKIEEPVVLELLKLSSLERLKKIDQSGYYTPYVSHEPVSRFEHSLGCYFLLDRFNASLEEKIAGLLHDVSHSVFSHCIDYVLSDSGKDQSYQDDIFVDFVLKTEIPLVLKKHNLDVDYILNENNFPLQEKNLPNLCADRIDYSLRSLITFNEADKEDVSEILNNFIILENEWVFKDVNIAQKYANYFKGLNDKHYCGINSAVMFQRVANYLNYALEKKYITKDDLYKTEDFVLDKINANLGKDDILVILWDDMNNKYGFEKNVKDYDYHIFCKSRIIDPKVLNNGKIVNLSDVNTGWKEIVLKDIKPVEHFIKTYVKKI